MRNDERATPSYTVGIFSKGYLANCTAKDGEGVSWHLVWVARGGLC
jgi:hypothetical protein